MSHNPLLFSRFQQIFSQRYSKAILIDMDGTIVDSLPTLYEAYLLFLKKYGHAGTQQEFQALIGPSIPEVIAQLKKTYAIQGDLTSLLDHYQSGLLTAYRKRMRVFPFVREVLDYAKEEEFKLALVTSAEDSFVDACLEGLSLVSFFDVLVPHHSFLRSKPAPDLYLKALDLLEVDAHEALAIEDSPHGVMAATSAGVFTLWLTPEPFPNLNIPQENYLNVPDWHTIFALLKGAINEGK